MLSAVLMMQSSSKYILNEHLHCIPCFSALWAMSSSQNILSCIVGLRFRPHVAPVFPLCRFMCAPLSAAGISAFRVLSPGAQRKRNLGGGGCRKLPNRKGFLHVGDVDGFWQENAWLALRIVGTYCPYNNSNEVICMRLFYSCPIAQQMTMMAKGRHKNGIKLNINHNV